MTNGREPEVPPTISEIARRAEVAPESVVRTLRGEPVSEASARQVVAVLQEIENERPGSLARLVQLRNPSVEPEASTELEIESPMTPAGVIRSELEELESTMRGHQADRVQDISVMVDLLRTRWRAADARLARIERLASRG